MKLKNLNEKNIEIVRSLLKGKRLENFNISVNAIQSSLNAGGWVSGLSRSANKGFAGTGISLEDDGRTHDSYWASAQYKVAQCLKYGYSSSKLTYVDIVEVANRLTPKDLKKISPEQLIAWCELHAEAGNACKLLDSLRPLPVRTEVGLSPRVTTTLKELGLDIDLQSVEPAEIAVQYIPMCVSDVKSPDFGKIIIREVQGTQYCPLATSFYVKWTEGIKHDRSRFSWRTGHCEACGKNIPSRQFVCLEAKDNKTGDLVSLVVGCDCSRNLFGIKDEGLQKGAF